MLKQIPSKTLCQACFVRKDAIKSHKKNGKQVTDHFLSQLQLGN
jgi:hypothetical protein